MIKHWQIQSFSGKTIEILQKQTFNQEICKEEDKELALQLMFSIRFKASSLPREPMAEVIARITLAAILSDNFTQPIDEKKTR